MGPSLQQKGSGRGMPFLQARKRRPLLLLKFILAPTICSYFTNAFFTDSMSERLDTKTDIIGEERSGGNPAGPTAQSRKTLSAVRQRVNPIAENRFESGDLQTRRQKPMIHPIEGLGLI